MASDLAQRFEQIEQAIASACARVGRSRESVQLVAVSKFHSEQAVRAAYALGQRDFGENYGQALRDKAEHLADLPDLRWHAIGPLQVNKARYVARWAFSFHALDREEIAAELSRRREGAALRCFVEVNIGAESSKAGVSANELELRLPVLKRYAGLEVVGLMGLPPLGETPEHSRPYFRELRALANKVGLKELSMGTTADFEVAIEEGATVVRVGTALFGERETKPA